MMKRLLSGILAVFLLTAVSCGDTRTAEKSRVTHVYESTEIALSEDCSIDAIYPTDGGILVLCTENEQPVLHLCDTVTGELTSRSLPAVSETTMLMGVSPLADGGVAHLSATVDMETMHVKFIMQRLDDGGSTILCDDVMGAFPVTFGGGSYIDRFAADAAGNLYFSVEQTVFVFDPQMQYLFEIEVPGRLNDMAADANGQVYVRYRDTKSGSRPLCYVDVAAKTLGDALAVPENFGALLNPSYYVGPGYGLYVNSGGAVYGFDAGAEPVMLLDWVNSDLIPGSVYDLIVIDRDTFVINYAESDRSGLYLLEHVPDEEVPEKYVITVAAKSTQTAAEAVRFNRQSDEYRVVIQNYGVYNSAGNTGAAEDMLAADFLAGNAPDVVMLGEFNNREQLLEEDYFADLYPLMDADDGFSREMLFDSVLAPFEHDGELREMVVEFTLDTLLGKRANVPYEAWTVDEFLDWAESQPDGTFLLQNMRRTSMLYTMLDSAWDTFVDVERGKCDFTLETFRRMLEFCAGISDTNYRQSLSGDELADYTADANSAYRDDKILLNDAYVHGGVSTYLAASATFGFDNVVFVGYPTSGDGNGTRIQPLTSAAITGVSPVKEGAWEFLRWLTVHVDTRGSIPAYRAAFDEFAAEEMEMHWFFRHDGGTSGSKSSDFLTRYSDSQGIYRDITDADVEAMRALINGASAAPSWSAALREIINEEVAMYFAGDKPLDETVDVIQSRCGTYLAERNG